MAEEEQEQEVMRIGTLQKCVCCVVYQATDSQSLPHWLIPRAVALLHRGLTQ